MYLDLGILFSIGNFQIYLVFAFKVHGHHVGSSGVQANMRT